MEPSTSPGICIACVSGGGSPVPGRRSDRSRPRFSRSRRTAWREAVRSRTNAVPWKKSSDVAETIASEDPTLVTSCPGNRCCEYVPNASREVACRKSSRRTSASSFPAGRTIPTVKSQKPNRRNNSPTPRGPPAVRLRKRGARPRGKPFHVELQPAGDNAETAGEARQGAAIAAELPVRITGEVVLAVPLQVGQRPKDRRDVHATGTRPRAPAAQAAVTGGDRPRIPAKCLPPSPPEPLPPGFHVLVDLGEARHARDRRRHAPVFHDPRHRCLVRA